MAKRIKTNTVYTAVGIAFMALALISVIVVFVLQDRFYTVDTEESSRPFVRGFLYFNEVMASNSISYSDENGEFFDWIELYNSYEKSVDLTGYTISQGLTGQSWKFPAGAEIPSNGFLILFCSGTDSEGLYLPFKINKKGGEELYIKDENGYIVDRMKTSELKADTVLSRSPGGVWSISDKPTPMFENTENGEAEYVLTLTDTSVNLKITEICTRNIYGCKCDDGSYYDWIELSNFGESDVRLDGFYLTDDDYPLKWQFPDITLKRGDCLLVFASGLDFISDNELHTDFKLSDSAGEIRLFNKRGLFVTGVKYEAIREFCTLSFSENDGYIQTFFQTPGYPYNERSVDLYLKKEEEALKTLIISEIMLNNDTFLPTDGGRYYDWIELTNISRNEINLSSFYLSDNYDLPEKYRLPDKVLAPGEYCIVFLSGDSAATTPMYPHASFKLDNKNEMLLLSDRNGVMDRVLVKSVPYGYSYGRVDGLYGFFYTDTPTPGGKNAKGSREISESPTVSPAEGVYNNVTGLSVSLSAEGEVFYTTDGSKPDRSSIKADGAITLDKTTVLRAVAYEKNKLPSEILTASYIVNENHTVDVVSLVTDPVNLWDNETGIYATGPNAAAEYPYTGANYYNDWERDAYITLFSGDKTEFSLGCGVEIFGLTGRVKPKKSFQIKFKGKYGENCLRCPLFSSRPEITRFESFVLRSGSQDYDRSVFRDELLTGLVDRGGLEMLTQAYRVCVLYLNGEYWGIYFIREKVDEDFLSQHLNVNAESFTLLRGNGQRIYGTDNDYHYFYNYASKLDMTMPDNYAYVKSKIDINSFIDYFISQAFTGNRDLTNVKYYKSTETDGKWRWIFFDQDYGFDYAYAGQGYTLTNLLNELGIGYENKIKNSLLIALFKSPEFTDLFLTRYGYFLSTAFAEEKIFSAIDALDSLLSAETERNAARWGFKVSTYKWYLSNLKDFVNDGVVSRASILIEEAKTLFSLDDMSICKYFYPELFKEQYPEEYAALHPEEVEEVNVL